MKFDFIHQAIQEVAYPHFFHTEPLTDFERKRLDALPQLPPSYVEFLNTFGRAKFFRELERNEHHLFVSPPPGSMHFYGDTYMMDVARTDSTEVSFKFCELALGAEPPLYDIALGIAPASPRRRADSFMDWLTRAWERCRRRYTKKAWAKVLSGPTPFTQEEQRIVEIRSGFSWRQLAPQNGMVAIEFTNASDGELPYYCIGVKQKYGSSMVGGFRLDVAHIKPGTKDVVYMPMGGYSHLITAENSVLFDKGEPKPETRGDFWEFRAING
jgi:hypothetical protein